MHYRYTRLRKRYKAGHELLQGILKPLRQVENHQKIVIFGVFGGYGLKILRPPPPTATEIQNGLKFDLRRLERCATRHLKAETMQFSKMNMRTHARALARAKNWIFGSYGAGHFWSGTSFLHIWRAGGRAFFFIFSKSMDLQLSNTVSHVILFF